MRILKRILISIFVFGAIFAGSKAYLSKFDNNTNKEVQKNEAPSQSIENDFTLKVQDAKSEESSSYDNYNNYSESEDESSNGNYYTDEFYNNLYYNNYDDGEY